MQMKVLAEGPDLVKVCVAGRIDQSHFQPEVEPLEQILGPEVYQRQVLLDLNGVELLDSCGVGWLLKCHRRFRDRGGSLVLHSLAPMVANVLRILRMDHVLQTAGTEAEAVRRAQESRLSP